jgi:hypothetical protein
MADSILDVKDLLNEYSDSIQEGIDKEAQDISKQAANELKNHRGSYTVRTGKYNKGWKVNTKKGGGIIKCTVHNATDWQLTHLLENGHTTRNGGRTRAFVHIRPVEEKYVNQYQQDVEKLIKNGG